MKIIHDPLPLGGFSIGAEFDKTTLEAMLEEGCFTEGTIIELHVLNLEETLSGLK